VIAALAVAALGTLLFGAETIVVAQDTAPTGLDTRVLEAANDLNTGAGVALAKIVTVFGTLPVTGLAALVTAILLVRAGRAADAAMLAASVIAIYIAVHAVKAATDRPRPPDPVVHASLAAFPSGHAAYSTIYVAIALLSRRGAAVIAAALALACAIGASRVYLRVHWATDVLAGWALGAAIFGAAAAIALVVGRFRNNEARTVPWP
jgi:membrane-associated phospholipid phosphatase